MNLARDSIEDVVSDLEIISCYLNTIEIADIIVENRFRKDLGDIERLAQSIQEFGLQNPIRVREIIEHDGRKKYKLISGRRRLEAHKHLGRTQIQAIIDRPTNKSTTDQAITMLQGDVSNS